MAVTSLSTAKSDTVARLHAVTSELAALPPLVFAGECELLTERLAAVTRERPFVLQGGDCAETFEGATAEAVCAIPPDEYAVRLAVDTNTLIDNPDLAAHVGTLGKRYMAHLLPVVLREIDDLKRGGKTPQLREAAQRADRRLEGAPRQRGHAVRRPCGRRGIRGLRAHRATC